jgi:hypothetical protein
MLLAALVASQKAGLPAMLPPLLHLMFTPELCMPCMQVLQYALPSSTSAAAATEQSSQQGDSEFLLQVLDNALPQQLLLHLQQVFAPAAPFWREHSYGRVGYFSYFFRLVSVVCDY